MLQHQAPLRRSERRRTRPESPLFDLSEPNVNRAIVRRTVPSGVRRELEQWARGTKRSASGTFDIGREESLALPRGLSTRTVEYLRADALHFLTVLARFARVDRMRYFLGRIDTDRCSKFHVDYVRYRLMTTYVGPGTEWVPDEFVNRPALEHPPECSGTANCAIVKDLNAVERAQNDEVLVLKGQLAGLGAVHRSPHIGDSGQVRFVLIASTIDGPA